MRPTSLWRGARRPSLLRTQGSRGAVAHAPTESVASTASALARATAEYRRPVAGAQPAASEPDPRAGRGRVLERPAAGHPDDRAPGGRVKRSYCTATGLLPNAQSHASLKVDSLTQ